MTVLELAERLGNVSEACRRGGIDRTSFYEWKQRFLQMCWHYLVEPVARTPRNQVGVARQRLLTPRLRFKSYDELNAWLLDRGVAMATAQAHPEVRDRTI